jgi:hypothetical protein
VASHRDGRGARTCAPRIREIRQAHLRNARERLPARMSRVLEMLRDLVAHKVYANAALLTAIRAEPDGCIRSRDEGPAPHILLANRFWLLTVLGLPFVHQDEARPSSSFDALIDRYGRTHAQETTWLETATEGDMKRSLEDALIPLRPGGRRTRRTSPVPPAGWRRHGACGASRPVARLDTSTAHAMPAGHRRVHRERERSRRSRGSPSSWRRMRRHS